MLTRGTDPEVRTDDEDRSLIPRFLVQNEVGLGAPRCEQPVFESGTGNPLKVDCRDDLVGVDVGTSQGTGTPVWVMNASISALLEGQVSGAR